MTAGVELERLYSVDAKCLPDKSCEVYTTCLSGRAVVSAVDTSCEMVVVLRLFGHTSCMWDYWTPIVETKCAYDDLKRYPRMAEGSC